jgi:hypothetical protein
LGESSRGLASALAAIAPWHYRLLCLRSFIEVLRKRAGAVPDICLGLAWWYDEGMFATLFAAEAAWAGVEAVYLSQ